MSAPFDPIDFTYDAGYMWGLYDTTVYRLDLSTGTVTTFAGPGGIISGAFGAAWTDTNGDLGFSNNNTGDIYKISVANPSSGAPTFVLLESYFGPVAGSSNDGAACTGTADADLGISETGPATVSPGGTISWTLTVTNHGPGDSSNFSVTDPIPSGVTNAATSTPGCSITVGSLLCSEGALANGASFVITVTGNAPSSGFTCVDNTANVTGSEYDPNPANNTTSLQTCAAALSVTKSVTSSGPYDAAGQAIDYQFVATNTGNVTLTSVGITDTQAIPAQALTSGPTCQSLSSPSGSCSGSTATLAPGQSATFTGSYTVTQADLDAGSVNDSATASGTPPAGSSVTSPPSQATVGMTQAPLLSVTKSVTSSGPYDAAGQAIDYQFVATNTGNVTLTSVGITDTQAIPAQALTSGPTCQSLSSPSGSCSGSTATLAPGQSATFTGSYTITQADLDAGSVHDAATASGTPPAGPAVTSSSSQATVGMTQAPLLSVTKSVTSSGPYDAAGQAIDYQFVATNTGNVTLTSVGITDTQAIPAQALTSGPTCQSLSSPSGSCSGSTATLAPGQSATFTGSYTITQADLDAGSVHDAATASGTPPAGPAVTSSSSQATVGMTQAPLLSVTKSVTSSGPYDAAGQAIDYQFVATNTGNVTLTSVGITDTQAIPAQALTSGPTCQSLSSPSGSCSGSTATLAPGQSATFTGSYTITQADLDAGSVHDAATASGTPPAGPAVTSSSSQATVGMTQAPLLSVTKSVTSSGPYDAAGQAIDYQFVATNTGNVTLTSVGITDTQAIPAQALTSGPTCQSLSSPSGSCSGSTATLAPGQSATFTGSYTITQADLDAGSVHDAATASGTPPAGPAVTSPASTAVVVTAAQCTAGSYSKSGRAPCTLAPVGSYVSGTGATSATPCPVGKTTQGTGSTSAAACVWPLVFTSGAPSGAVYGGYYVPQATDGHDDLVVYTSLTPAVCVVWNNPRVDLYMLLNSGRDEWADGQIDQGRWNELQTWANAALGELAQGDGNQFQSDMDRLQGWLPSNGGDRTWQDFDRAFNDFWYEWGHWPFGAVVRFVGVGNCEIQAVAVDDTGAAVSTTVTQTLSVSPAPLWVTASSATMTAGQAIPTITPFYRGFVNGDTVASLASPAVCSSTATASVAGTYTTSCHGASDPNYTITYTAGFLVIYPAPPGRR